MVNVPSSCPAHSDVSLAGVSWNLWARRSSHDSLRIKRLYGGAPVGATLELPLRILPLDKCTPLRFTRSGCLCSARSLARACLT